jgi:O-antigen chain-terminating methyltransferase
MAGDGRTDRDSAERSRPDSLREWLRSLYWLTPWGLRRVIGELRAHVADLFERVDDLGGRVDDRLAPIDRRLDAIETNLGILQSELERLRDDRAPHIEERLDAAETAAADLESEVSRLRDAVVPAVVERGNVLIDRLSEELEEVASLVERMLRSEPLPAPEAGEAFVKPLAEVQPLLLEALRGDEHEIRHRLDAHLPMLVDAGPVLALGCGRGELLLMLRESGVEARGVDADGALVQAARRRGLEVDEGEVLELMQGQPAGSWGAVTAFHLFEHLEPAELLQLLAEARRILRPGGLLLAECPNPHSLRVGGALFWIDPTHRRPLLPESLELYLRASGFDVQATTFLHPFPSEQRLFETVELPAEAAPETVELGRRLEELGRRLDQLLNGPRDFAIVAVKPDTGGP